MITPPLRAAMSGFVGRAGAVAVHDDLCATALVLESRDEQQDPIAIVSLDLIGLYSDRLVADLKARIEDVAGIGAERVFLSCTHTHYGPVVAAEGDMPGGDTAAAARYREFLAQQIAACVAEARRACRPVTVRAAGGRARIGINRRLPLADGSVALAPNAAGHVDEEVLAIRLETAEPPDPLDPPDAADTADVFQPRHEETARTIATLVNYACHPSSLGSEVRDISADFPGTLRAELEAETGGHTLFLQGAAGDIDPAVKADDWSASVEMGRELGVEASVQLSTAAPGPAAPLVSIRRTVAVSRRSPATIADADALIADLSAELGRRDRDDPTNWWIRLRLAEASAALPSLERGELPRIDADLSVVRLGDCALVFVPAELFSALGVEIRQRSPARHTMVVGYTDGMLWYVPTREAFAEGGYEVDDACRVTAEAGEMIVTTAVELIRDAFAQDFTAALTRARPSEAP